MLLKRNYECDNVVFTMWLQGYGDMPAVVRACLESMKRLKKDYYFNRDEFTRLYFFAGLCVGK